MYRYFFIAFISFFLIPGVARSQESSITAEVFAEVIEALAANEDQALNFGRFTTGNNGGSIVISPGGIRSAQGSVIAAGGGYSPGKFLVEGEPGATFSIQLPRTATTLVHSESGKTMDVEGWVSDPPSGDAATLSDGERLVSIGATLNIGPVDENPVGIYSGSFIVTFAYN
ncbi:DUF4402 domain-containing protein [Maribellus maritimus]|uniref:DUF4402 domain-containing protein n=1 Tax=Maribellus maritimus TaxID=2870838 RepID=UPI001EEA8CFE|nr:DUF4402 domain-containing protein [Maribellus maritimus]MCG6188899.1 DUF4402 domain-containing protein [Maribellus maritimus]